ncbi:unnamed protein product, partial [Tilletia controversa]
MEQTQNQNSSDVGGRGGRGGRGGGRGGSSGGRGGSSGAASISPPNVPGVTNLNDLNDQLQAAMKQNNTAMQNWVNGTLDKYHKAASSFATTHNIANLEDVQVSGRKDERIVIVLNAVEFDGLQDVMRGQREVGKTVQDAQDQLKETQDQLTEAQASIRILEQQVQTLTQDRRTLPRGRGVKRTRNEEDENETTDEDEPQTHKRIRTGHGRKDNRIQRAFERLLRLRMGLAAKEGWPFFPNVDSSSSEWPREVPEVDMEDPDANID